MNAKKVALALGTALAPSLAHAATITVNSLADAPLPIVPVTDGQCTLREAIENANDDAATHPDCAAGSGADTIDFSVTGTIVQTFNNAFHPASSMSIVGPGAALLTIDGDTPATGTIFAEVFNDTFSISGITVANGQSTGIRIRGAASATVADTVITGNTAPAAAGLYLYDIQEATVLNTVISGNTATGGTGLWANRVWDLTIENSEISGNHATGSNAGVVIFDSVFRMINSTVANNTATNNGGGIVLVDEPDVLIETAGTIDVSTISNNSAGAQGGNIRLDANTTLTITNSIVANGTAATGPDIFTAPTADLTANWTLIETTTGATIGGANNLTGVDPQLGPLQNNGGPTRTMLPAASSPAVNAGDPAFVAPNTDQRGLPRPVLRVDMGAVELQVTTADLNVTKSVAGSGPFTTGQNVTFNVQVVNNGPGAAANVTITDVLPAGTSFVAATPSAGSCTGTTTVVCNVGTLANAATANVQVTVQLTQSGPITNIATATSDATDPTPASGSVTITAAAEGEPIPTLSEWMLLALASAIAAAAAMKLRQ